MPASLVVELPAFDTGEFEGSELHMAEADAVLTLRVAGMAPLRIRFRRVRWHRFTASPNCTAAMIDEAYFRVVQDRDSPAVADFMREDSASAKAYSRLGHYRIFLDERGCHEFFAESAERVETDATDARARLRDKDD